MLYIRVLRRGVAVRLLQYVCKSYFHLRNDLSHNSSNTLTPNMEVLVSINPN